MSWHQIQKIFPGLLNICAKFEEIPSTRLSKDVIGRQTCGAGGYGGPFRENSSHMQTSVPRGTLNYQLHMTQITKIFGYCIQDQNFKPVNFILLISRKYIFWCAQNKFIPNFLQLKKLIHSSDECDCEMRTWKDLLSED